MVVPTTALRAESVLAELQQCGVTHLLWLPDSETGHMYRAIQASSLGLVRICREGESMPIAAGLLAGGQNPVVFIQNTGLFESGDSLRGVALELKLPLLLLVGYRGYAGASVARDSAARWLEPTLRSWDIPYRIVRSDADASVISACHRQAHDESRPVAALIAKEYEA